MDRYETIRNLLFVFVCLFVFLWLWCKTLTKATLVGKCLFGLQFGVIVHNYREVAVGTRSSLVHCFCNQEQREQIHSGCCSTSLLYSFTVQDSNQGSDIIHGGLDLPHWLIKTIRHRHAHRWSPLSIQPYIENSSWMTPDCVKVTIRTKGVVAHAFNLSIQEAEAGSLSLRPIWSTEWLLG